MPRTARCVCRVCQTGQSFRVHERLYVQQRAVENARSASKRSSEGTSPRPGDQGFADRKNRTSSAFHRQKPRKRAFAAISEMALDRTAKSVSNLSRVKKKAGGNRRKKAGKKRPRNEWRGCRTVDPRAAQCLLRLQTGQVFEYANAYACFNVPLSNAFHFGRTILRNPACSGDQTLTEPEETDLLRVSSPRSQARLRLISSSAPWKVGFGFEPRG